MPSAITNGVASAGANGRMTQANRQMAIEVAGLNSDALLLDGFAGEEGVSKLFAFDLKLLSDSGLKVLPAEVLGKPATVRLQQFDGTPRFFHGILSSFRHAGRGSRFQEYGAQLVPWFWLLTRSTNCRVFQFKTVRQILKDLFDEALARLQIPGCFVEDRTAPGAGPRDYCVQYRETDFHFACRLMEEEGICWFFTHEKGKHTLVLADAPSHFRMGAKARFHPSADGVEWDNVVIGWGFEEHIRTGRHSLRDYHFEMPEKRLPANAAAKIPWGGNSRLEAYDYPGGYAKDFIGKGGTGCDRLNQIEGTDGAAEREVRLRMEEEQVKALLLDGTSNCRGFSSGQLVGLDMLPERTRDPMEDLSGAYLLIDVHHTASGGSYPGGDGFHYGNTFTALPQNVKFFREKLQIPQPLAYRPPRVTPRPIMHGPQTAVVVGLPGEEICVDKYGRVKVQFHWDREGKLDETSSCWVRVAQVWAGKRWGASFWPRVGQEVIVAFLEGDPDRPIITGSVYNGAQMPPYLGEGPDRTHPHDPKLSGIKTCSTPGGNGFNELRFDDTKGKEQLFIHAERRKDEQVEGDSLEYVGNDRHLIVVGNQLEKVGVNKNLTVEGDQFEAIRGDMVLYVGDAMHEVVHGNKGETVDGDVHRACFGNVYETIEGSSELVVSGNLIHHVDGRFTVKTDLSMHFSSEKKIVLESMDCITLRVGRGREGSYVQITEDAVVIFGPEVRLNCGTHLAKDGYGFLAPVTASIADDADPAVPNGAADARTGFPSAPGAKIAPPRHGAGSAQKKGKGGTKKHELPPPRTPEEEIIIGSDD